MASRSGLRLVRKPVLLTARGNAELFRRAAVPALLQMGRESTGSIREKVMAERHDRGILANAVTPLPPVVVGLRAEQSVVVQPPADAYGYVVEEKRTPGRRPPPVEPIRAWILRTDKGRSLLSRFLVDRKGLSRERGAVILARRLARSIGRKGIQGIGMFRRAREEMASGRARAIYQAHVARAKAELGG